MSSSYAQYVRCDTACEMDLSIDEDQTDNAADTGSMAGELGIALRIINGWHRLARRPA